MPMNYVPPFVGGQPTTRFRFWLKGSGGASQSETLDVPQGWSDDQIQDELDSWAGQFLPRVSSATYGCEEVQDG